MFRLSAASLTLLLGCTPNPGGVVQGSPAPLSVEAVVEVWARSPAEGAAALAALPTHEEQLLAARTLLDRGEVQGAGVCAYLTDPGTRSYCRELAMRPHLFEDRRPQQASRVRSAGGPVDSELLPTVAVESPATTAPALPPTGCPAATSTAACAHAGALAAADRGSLDEIAGRCNAIDAPKLRAECRFAAGERALERHSVKAVPFATELCLAAEEFTPHCLAHGVSALAARAPVATARAAEWDPLLAAAAGLNAAITPYDPVLAGLVEQRLWAEAAAVAYRQAPQLDGSPLALLPESAGRPVRDSLAYELIARGEVSPAASLDAAVAALAAAEARRGPPAAAKPVRGQPSIVRDRYPAPNAESGCYPTAYWRGAAIRATDPDPTLDRALSILEASTAFRGPSDALARGAIDHPQRIVAWSAARLTNQPGAAGPPGPGDPCG